MTEIRGWLDFPLSESEALPGGTLRVAGWVLFDDVPADRVEVWFGDAASRPVRRGLARQDVVTALALDSPPALACGFESLVPVPRAAAGEAVTLQVRAWSSTGRTWVSDPTDVRVALEAPETPPLVGTDLTVHLPESPNDGPLRVMAFTHSLKLGGGELYLDELLARLRADHGVEVLLVSPGTGALTESSRKRSMAVHVTLGYGVNPEHYEGRIHEFQTLIASWRPHVVLANTVSVFPPVDAALRLGVPVIWAIHESFMIEESITLNWGNRGLAPAIEERMRQSLSRAHTIFEAQSTLLLYAEQLPELHGRHIHYGIDLAAIAKFRAQRSWSDLRAEHGFSDDAFVILCMGVIQDRKAQLALVLAFWEVAPLFPAARLVLVGAHESEYSRSVEEAVTCLGLDDRVDVLPIQPETYPWYAMADALVSASDVESLPRSILEAKAFGLPTLATDVFGLSEIITDGVNGWLCRPHSGNALVAGLFRVLSSDPASRSEMAAACLDEAPRFDGSNYARAYYELAENLRRRHSTSLLTPSPGDDA